MGIPAWSPQRGVAGCNKILGMLPLGKRLGQKTCLMCSLGELQGDSRSLSSNSKAVSPISWLGCLMWFLFKKGALLDLASYCLYSFCQQS